MYVSEPSPAAADIALAPQLTSPSAVLGQLPSEFKSSPQEEVWLITVGAGLRPISVRLVARGGRASCQVDRAVIARHCILDLASGAFLAHNHPSGDPAPSALDRSFTAAVREALALFDIDLHDHLVVTAAGRWASC